MRRFLLIAAVVLMCLAATRHFLTGTGDVPVIRPNDSVVQRSAEDHQVADPLAQPERTEQPRVHIRDESPQAGESPISGAQRTTIRGLVQFRDKTPFPNARLVAIEPGSERRLGGEFRTDQNGRFEAEIPSQSTSGYIVIEQISDRVVGQDRTTRQVSEESEWIVTLPGCRLPVKVIDSGYETVDDATVFLRYITPNSESGLNPEPKIRKTREDGSCIFSVSAPKRVHVWASSADGTLKSDKTDLEVVAGCAINHVTLRLATHSLNSLTVLVHDGAHQPVPGAAIIVRSLTEESALSRRIEPLEDGRVSLNDLPDGDYSIAPTRPLIDPVNCYEPLSVEKIQLGPSNRDQLVELAVRVTSAVCLELKGGIEGADFTVQLKGRDQPNDWVDIVKFTERQGESVTAHREISVPGRYLSPSLEPGTYALRLRNTRTGAIEFRVQQVVLPHGGIAEVPVTLDAGR